MKDNPNGNTVNDRLDRSINGAPRLNPDEQRKYLGTFRERVSLAIKIKDLNHPNAYQGFQRDVKDHPEYLLIINGNLPNDLISKYIDYASQHQVQFTIKTDKFYRNSPDAYGLIYASHHSAINQYPINVNQKYPDHSTSKHDQTSVKTNHVHKESFWTKLKQIF